MLDWLHWPTYRYRSTCGCPILCTVKTGNEAASFINFKPSRAEKSWDTETVCITVRFPRQIERNWREFAIFWRDEEPRTSFRPRRLALPNPSVILQDIA
jgi:hypothetical protein